jgi:DNA polymerase-3 subunit gamma/tau
MPRAEQNPGVVANARAAANPAVIANEAVNPAARSRSEPPQTAGPTSTIGPTSSASPAVTGSAGTNLAELWQQILASLELPSTRMLLSQQGELVRLDGQRAVVRVAPNWVAMVQSRLPLLEQAAERALGQHRQVVLETGTATIHQAEAKQPEAAAKPNPATTIAPTTASPQSSSQTAAAPAIPAGTLATPMAASPTPAPAPAAPQPGKMLTAPPAASTETSNPANTTPASIGQLIPHQSSNGLQVQAQRLAEFFNGEVISAEDDEQTDMN